MVCLKITGVPTDVNMWWILAAIILKEGVDETYKLITVCVPYVKGL